MKWLLVVSLLIWYCLYEWELECSKQQKCKRWVRYSIKIGEKEKS